MNICIYYIEILTNVSIGDLSSSVAVERTALRRPGAHRDGFMDVHLILTQGAIDKNTTLAVGAAVSLSCAHCRRDVTIARSAGYPRQQTPRGSVVVKHLCESRTHAQLYYYYYYCCAALSRRGRRWGGGRSRSHIQIHTHTHRYASARFLFCVFPQRIEKAAR